MTLNELIKILSYYKDCNYGGHTVNILWDVADGEPTGKIFTTDDTIVIECQSAETSKI